MKTFLKKRMLGLPIAAWLLIVTAVGVAAAFAFSAVFDTTVGTQAMNFNVIASGINDDSAILAGFDPGDDGSDPSGAWASGGATPRGASNVGAAALTVNSPTSYTVAITDSFPGYWSSIGLKLQNANSYAMNLQGITLAGNGPEVIIALSAGMCGMSFPASMGGNSLVVWDLEVTSSAQASTVYGPYTITLDIVNAADFDPLLCP